MQYRLDIIPKDSGGFAFELSQKRDLGDAPIPLISASSSDLAKDMSEHKSMLTSEAQRNLDSASGTLSSISLADALNPVVNAMNGVADSANNRLSVLRATDIVYLQEPSTLEVHTPHYDYAQIRAGQFAVYSADNTMVACLKTPGSTLDFEPNENTLVLDVKGLSQTNDTGTRLTDDQIQSVKQTLTQHGVMRIGNTVLTHEHSGDNPNALMRNQIGTLLYDAKVVHAITTLSQEAADTGLTATRDENGLISIHTLDDDDQVYDTITLSQEESTHFLRQCQNMGEPEDLSSDIPGIDHQMIRDAVAKANMDTYAADLAFPPEPQPSPGPGL